MKQTYYIYRNEAFTGLPPLKVEYEYPPPCLFCDEPVTSPSTDGPLICGPCDCGWDTPEENARMWANRIRKIKEIEANQ